MVVETKIFREGADGKRYPWYYRGAALTRSDSLKSSGKDASASEASENEGTPSRPKRNRARPQNFINYRQENEVGVPGDPVEKLLPEEPTNPYEDLVFWTKCYNHPYWPSVKCTEEEIRFMQENDGIDFEKESKKHGGAEVTAVLFLGSNTKGIVKTAEIYPYVEYFDKYSRKKSGLQFRIGLEKADELVLQARAQLRDDDACAVCSKPVILPNAEDESTLLAAIAANAAAAARPGTDDGLACARCLTPVHAKCTEKAERPGVLANAFDNELAPVWFCGPCARHAPATVRSRTEQEARALKRALKRKTQRSSDSARKSRASTPPLGFATAERRNGSVSALEQLTPARSATVAALGGTRGSAANTPRSFGGRDLANGSAAVSGGASVSSATVGKRKDAGPQDAHDDLCFICGDGGVLLMCDFPKCPKSYHKYCLRGVEGMDDGENDDSGDKAWCCPWHMCAVCGAEEHQAAPQPQQHQLRTTAGGQSTSSSSTSSSGSTGSATGHANGTGAQNLGRKRSALPPPPALTSIRVPTILDADMPAPTTPTRLERTSSDTVEGFVRCASCPTSLCTKHMRAARPVFDGKTHSVPHAIGRPAKRGYFKCVHCVGGSRDGPSSQQQHQPSPLVQLAQLLHRVWSRVVNAHDRLCQIFLEEADIAAVPPAGRRILEQLRERGGVRSLLDVRDKVWRLEYRDWASFDEDINKVTGLVRAIYGGSSPLIKETAGTLPLLVTQAHAGVARQIAEAEERIADLKSVPGPASDAEAFATGGLFPSVVVADRQSGRTRPVGKRRSIDEWERFLENSTFAASKKHVDPGARPVREEAHGIAAALLAAAQSHSGFNDHLPPSRQTLDEMLENQSMVLRSALRGTAMLRDAVSRTLEGFASSELSSDGVVTLGEMRLAAEYRMVNRNLRAKNANLATLLSIERAAREQLEKRVQDLEAELQTTKRPAIALDGSADAKMDDVVEEKKDDNESKRPARQRASPASKRARVAA